MKSLTILIKEKFNRQTLKSWAEKHNINYEYLKVQKSNNKLSQETIKAIQKDNLTKCKEYQLHLKIRDFKAV